MYVYYNYSQLDIIAIIELIAATNGYCDTSSRDTSSGEHLSTRPAP